MIRFVERSRLAIAMVGQLVAVPRTPLYDRLKKEGRVEAEDETGHDQKSASVEMMDRLG